MNIGDSVFLKNRVIGVVVDKYPNGRLSIEQEGPTYDRTRQIGFINGLTPDEREEFFKVMEEIRTISDPVSRYESLNSKIEGIRTKNMELEASRPTLSPEKQEESLKQERAGKNVIKYLQAELNHLASCKNIVPKIYTAEPKDV